MSAIEIRGYVGDVPDLKRLLARVDEISARFACDLQLVRGDRVLGVGHLARAAELAARAFAEERNSASAFGLETLRYAAGERQIARALVTLGLETGAQRTIAALARGERTGEALDTVASEMPWRRDDAALVNEPAAVLDALGVDEADRRTVPPERWPLLVFERIALVDLAK